MKSRRLPIAREMWRNTWVRERGAGGGGDKNGSCATPCWGGRPRAARLASLVGGPPSGPSTRRAFALDSDKVSHSIRTGDEQIREGTNAIRPFNKGTVDSADPRSCYSSARETPGFIIPYDSILNSGSIEIKRDASLIKEICEILSRILGLKIDNVRYLLII